MILAILQVPVEHGADRVFLACPQPKGGTEERSLAESTTAAKGVTKKILGARSIVSVGATIAPPSPSDSVLPRGCQAHTAMEASFSALEFLATAAAAQRVSSI